VRSETKWILALGVIGLLIAGTISTADASKKTHPLTGLGATKAEWAKTHHSDKSNCPGHSCFGYAIPGFGANGYQYSPMSYQDGRVIGWQGAFLNKTTIAEAEALVRKQLPSDIQVVSFTTSSGCAYWNLQSPTIARVLGSTAAGGDTTGVIGVEFEYLSADGTNSYNPKNVNSDTVGIASLVAGSGC
jgi:hypothetical protein